MDFNNAQRKNPFSWAWMEKRDQGSARLMNTLNSTPLKLNFPTMRVGEGMHVLSEKSRKEVVTTNQLATTS